MFFSSDVFEKKTSLGKTTTSSGKDNVPIRIDDDTNGKRSLVQKKVFFFSSPFVVVESLLAKTKAFETKREKSIERERERERERESPVGVR